MSTSLPERKLPAVAPLPTDTRTGLFSRDDPTFIACVLVAAFSAHYSPRGIDYFPSPEICMIYGYPLLATAIATFLLRPRSKHALYALLLASFLSLRTFASVCLSLSIFRRLAIWLWDSEPTGYLLLFKAFLAVTRSVGISFWASEIVFNILMTGCMFVLCTQAFSRISVRISAAAFLVAYIASCAVVYVAIAIIGPDFQLAQPTAMFMILQTALYWRLVSYASLREPSTFPETTA